MKCLITGINGFAASHLADRLLSKGHQVIGTKRIRSNDLNLPHLADNPNIKFVNMDINDAFGVQSVISVHKPDVIFHLAAQSFVGWSWSHPRETIETNVMGTLNILEAVRMNCPETRIHIASSSQVYGKIPETEQPMGLNTRFNPMNPYDSSKLAQDMLALQYFNSYGLKIIRTRAFNITGPRRGEMFAESSWAKQIAIIEKDTIPEKFIKHGNLDSWRDYIDVRDVVVGYEWAGLHGEPGEVYILGSGFPTQMSTILDMLLKNSLFNDITTIQDPSRMRPSDTPYMRAGDSILQKIVSEYGERNCIPLEQSLKDLLNYWRSKA